MMAPSEAQRQAELARVRAWAELHYPDVPTTWEHDWPYYVRQYRLSVLRGYIPAS